ncbi:MAG: LLM class F420-dependent oxidoreductase [Chloroflexi bacterium]|nr:LLM class F420-dependent oxidoreductase [Chloroflexota bacterium]
MEFGLHLPHVGPLATREGITAFAQLVEKLGFDALWVSDHIVVPRSVDSRYPYSRDGSFPVSPDVSLMEPIATLLFAAAVTERVKLGTTVLVLPMRNPIVTAKQLASLDVLSNGRLILGVGTGWMEEEFQMLGVPFKRRGARTNEYIRLMKALWTEENPSFEGEFWQIKDVGFNPKPLQKPHPPIWTGGHSAPALRRAGRLSDGWHAVGVSPDTLREQFKEVQRHAEKAGRDPASLTLSVRPRVRMDDPAKTIELLRSYREVGVSHVVLEIFAPDMDRVRSLMDTLANEIRPQVLA